MIDDIKQAVDNLQQTGAYGIKETMDLLALVEAAADTYEQAKADGKIDLDDIQYTTTLLMAAVEAFKGSDQIMAELKDIDAAEAAALFTKLFSVVQRLLKALTSKTVAVPVIFPVSDPV